MSLLPCDECGAEISIRAWLCPKCGCPRSTFADTFSRYLTHPWIEETQQKEINCGAPSLKTQDISRPDPEDEALGNPVATESIVEDSAAEAAPVDLDPGENERRRLALETIVAQCVSFGIALGALAFLFSGDYASVGTQLVAMTAGAGLGAVIFFILGKPLALYTFGASTLLKQFQRQGLAGVAEWARRGRKAAIKELPTGRHNEASVGCGVSAVQLESIAGSNNSVKDNCSSTALNSAAISIPSSLLHLINKKEMLLRLLESALEDQLKYEQKADASLLGSTWSNRGRGCFFAALLTVFGLVILEDLSGYVGQVFKLVVGGYAALQLARAWIARRSWRQQAQVTRENVLRLKQQLYEINRALASEE